MRKCTLVIGLYALLSKADLVLVNFTLNCVDLWGSCHRYDDPANKSGGQVWVRYENGHEAPLEGRSNNAAALG